MTNKNKSKGKGQPTQQSVAAQTTQTKPVKTGNRKRGKKGRKKGGKRMGGSLGNHHKIACSVLDPFCVHAMNAKFPDGQTINSLTYQSRFTYPIVIGANGYESICFSPDNNEYQILLDSTNGTWNAAFTAGDSATTAVIGASGFAENIRIVSAGMIFRWTYPSTQTRPTVTIADVSDSSDFLGQATVPTNVSSVGQNIKVLVGNQDIYWMMRPVDSNKRLWGTYIGGTSNRSKNYNACVAHIGGTTSATYGTMEFVINYEYTVKAGSAYNQFATSPPTANPIAISAAKAVQKSVVGAVQANSTTDFSQFLEKKAMTALDSVLNYGADMMMGLLI